MKRFSILLTIFTFSLLACAKAQVASESAPQHPVPPPVPKVIMPAPIDGISKPEVIIAKAETSAKPEVVANPEIAAKSESAVKAEIPANVDVVWKLKKGKLQGPGQSSAKVIGTLKDPKSGAVTTTRCWKYTGFSIIESQTTGEVGAGEASVRRASDSGKENLCAAEFKGKSENLNIIEGNFAGVAGDYILIEGADVSEGPPQFQIFSLATAKEVLKSNHHPDEEFTFSKRGHKTSLIFFAKIPVKCELAGEGAACWKKVLALSPPSQPTPMPNCTAAFAKAKVSPEESALVTIRAQVADLNAPKIQILGGKATCVPAPQ